MVLYDTSVTKVISRRDLFVGRYQVNKAKVGWVVTLMNNFGVDKTQTGLSRVDRTKCLFH